MRQPQQVAVRPTVALPVLRRLPRQLVRRLGDVPGCHRLTQQPAPAAEALHELREMEQMRPDPSDLRERLGSLTLRPRHGHGHRQDVQRRVVRRRAARGRDRHDFVDHPVRLGVEQLLDHGDVLLGQVPGRRIVRAAQRAGHQEPAQHLQRVHRKGVPARRVRDHGPARDRLALRRDRVPGPMNVAVPHRSALLSKGIEIGDSHL